VTVIYARLYILYLNYCKDDRGLLMVPLHTRAVLSQGNRAIKRVYAYTQ